MKTETVKIKHADGFAIINKDDYDPKVHEKFDAPKRGRPSKKVTNAD